MGLKNSNNLGDLSSPAIARRNLGLGTAAVKDAPLRSSPVEDDVFWLVYFA